MTDPDQTTDFMGTREGAEAAFLKACDRWTASMQPLAANAAEHRKRGAEEFEARWQLAHAAARLAWFMRYRPAIDPLEDFDCYTEAGWDGYDADPILPRAIEIARQILSLLTTDNLPDIAPGADGTIGFEWHFTDGPMRRLIIDVWPDKVTARVNLS